MSEIPESPLIGMASIAKYLAIAPSTLNKLYLDEMIEAGIVMPRTDKTKGFRVTTSWFTYPSLVQRWLIMRGGLGQTNGRACLRNKTRAKRLMDNGFQTKAEHAND